MIAVELLRCPVSRQPLVLSETDGQSVLQTADGLYRYPIVDGIPILLPAGAPNTIEISPANHPAQG